RLLSRSMRRPTIASLSSCCWRPANTLTPSRGGFLPSVLFVWLWLGALRHRLSHGYRMTRGGTLRLPWATLSTVRCDWPAMPRSRIGSAIESDARRVEIHVLNSYRRVLRKIEPDRGIL